MQERLPFFNGLEASQRASVQLVVQAAVVNFVEWMRDPTSQVGYTAQAFELVPQDLTRKIALAQTVDMVRVTMEFFEEVVPLAARNDEQLTALRVGILRYSRDLAFSAAAAYADAAEARGSWDSRMEASVVDAVVRGDTGPELLSGQRPELGHHRAGDRGRGDARSRSGGSGRRAGSGAGSGAQSRRSGRRARHLAHRDHLWTAVPYRPVLQRPAVDVLARAGGHRPQRPDADRRAPQRRRGHRRDERRGRLDRSPRPVLARELLPERALLGDASAVSALTTTSPGHWPTPGRPVGDPRCLSRQRRSYRGVRPKTVRSSKYGSLPPQADRRLHGPRPNRAPRRLRTAGCHHSGWLAYPTVSPITSPPQFAARYPLTWHCVVDL